MPLGFYSKLLLTLLAAGALAPAASAQPAPSGWMPQGKTFAAAGAGYRLQNLPAAAGPSFALSATCTPAATGEVGLIFRATPNAAALDSLPGAGYCAYLDAAADRVRLAWLQGGRRPRPLTSVPLEVNAGQAYALRVEAHESHLEVFVDKNHVISVVDTLYRGGQAGLWASAGGARAAEPRAEARRLPPLPRYSWADVRGAVFVPTSAVNEAEQWENFDPATNERELFHAAVYGLNTVRVYLHYLVWEKNPAEFLRNVETFLQLADRHGIRTEFVFFDDVWSAYPTLGPQGPPKKGVHNSRWLQSPGNLVKEDYARYRPRLQAYVQAVARAHLHDRRIAFWEPYNEPGNGQKGLYLDVTHYLLNDSRIWLKATGTSIPITSSGSPLKGPSGPQFANFESWVGSPYSDFYSYHDYEAKYVGPGGARVLNTESMNRKDQTIPGLVAAYRAKGTGYIVWEAGIGRDNCRYQWETPAGSPEPTVPFHGMIYPDGHPWDTLDVAAVRPAGLANLPVFNATYFARPDFSGEKKRSFTPRLDFDLGDEPGTGSPDASAGVPKDQFSVRYTGRLQAPQAGTYTFFADTDNLVRVYLDNQLILDKTSAGRAEQSATAPLEAGRLYALRVEYAHATGPASLHLRWQGPGLPGKTWLPGRR